MKRDIAAGWVIIWLGLLMLAIITMIAVTADVQKEECRYIREVDASALNQTGSILILKNSVNETYYIWVENQTDYITGDIIIVTTIYSLEYPNGKVDIERKV